MSINIGRTGHTQYFVEHKDYRLMSTRSLCERTHQSLLKETKPISFVGQTDITSMNKARS